MLQLKYLQSNTRSRIVQYPIGRWQYLLPGLCSEYGIYQTTLDIYVTFVYCEKRYSGHSIFVL